MGLFLHNNLNGIFYHYHISNEPASLSLKKKKRTLIISPCYSLHQTQKLPVIGMALLTYKFRQKKEVMRNVLSHFKNFQIPLLRNYYPWS